MKRIYILLGALLASLIVSYTTWTAEPGSASTSNAQVPIYKGTTRDLQSIHWSAKDLKVDVEQREDAQGAYRWITVTETVPPEEEPTDPFVHAHPDDPEVVEAAEPEVADTPEAHAHEEPAPPPETVVTSFLGNDSALTLWETFGPLHALRKLSDAGDPSIFGFDEDPDLLTIQRASGEVSLKVGAETYGSKDRFVQREADVFLVDDAHFRSLQHPKTHLVERRLFPMTETELTQILVHREGSEATYVQRHKDDRAQAFWANESSPDEEAKDAGLWLGKMLRMRLKSYVSGDEPEGLVPSFSFTVMSGEQRTQVLILRAPGDDGQDLFYARSSFTRSLVQLTRSLASDVVDDLASVLN
jgi:hypothetical protein